MRLSISYRIFVIFLITFLSQAYAFEFTKNEVKALKFKMHQILVNEVSHGNEKMFFLLDPNKALFINAEDLYNLYEDNAFRASKIVESYLLKIISGDIESINPSNSGAVIALQTSDTGFKRPITLFMTEQFSDKAYNLQKGEYLTVLCIVEQKYIPGINAIFMNGCTDPESFMLKHADIRSKSINLQFKEGRSQALGEYDMRDLFIANIIHSVGKKYEGFAELSDEEIENIMFSVEPNYEKYQSFKNDLISKSKKDEL